MKFIPKSEDQIARENCHPAGVYDFTITEALDTQSKKTGADMIKVSLQVFDEHGDSFLITDYIMEAMAFKLRHFAYGIGAGADYESGNLNASTVEGRSGKLRLVIKEDKTGQYPPKNEVKDYIVSESGAELSPRVPVPSAAANDPMAPPF